MISICQNGLDIGEFDPNAIREGIQKGVFSLEDLGWHSGLDQWQPLRQIIDVNPVAPVPSPRVLAKAEAVADPAASDPNAPKQATAIPKVKIARPRSLVVKERGFDMTRFVIMVMLVIFTGLAAVNYFLIDKPFRTNFNQTPYAALPVYEHFGGLVQPNALMVHVLPSKAINSDNFIDLVSTLIKSTPLQPINHNTFQIIGLTSGWQTQYLITGADWQELGEMSATTAHDRQDMLICHLRFANGDPVIADRENLSPAKFRLARDKAWNALLANFLAK
jgi:hypothetical protein